MRILYKFLIGFVLISLLVGLQAYIGYNVATSIQQRYNEASEETLPGFESLITIQNAGINIIQSTNEILHTSPDDPDYIDREMNDIAEYSEIFEKSFEIYENRVTTKFPDEKEHIDTIRASKQDIMRVSSELTSLKKQGNNELQIKERELEFEKSKSEFINGVNLALEHEKSMIKERTKQIENDMNKLIIKSIMFGLFSFFVALIMGFYLSNRMLAPIEKLKTASYEIGKGNLDTKLEFNTNDEFVALGKTFNQMSENLKHSISEQKILNEKIKSSLEEKEVLLREIHHRVKNNMQIVSSLLMLQSNNIEDKKYKDIFIDSQNRIHAMALIHEKLYQSENIEQINFKEYIESIVTNISESYGLKSNIKFNINIENIPIKIDYAIPCGLIINELVTNSLKYAFPDGRQGKIQISLKSNDNNMIQLSISDDGIGIPKDMDIRNTNSLGLKLVTGLAESQLHGKIILNRERGTEFQINFAGTK